jgi:hypothetical protein
VAASLLKELGYPENREAYGRKPKSERPTTRSPSSPVSPDYYPSEEEQVRERSRSRSPPTDHERQLEEAVASLFQAQTETTQLTKNLEELRVRFGRLRSRVIYLEGELAVYKRFAVIHSQEPKLPPPPQFFYPPPPPPPPRRV